ncbi:hypothetical protein DL96DRAFT_1595865 [Flagelloscypha sp. PMI_526]|nr:hypothetical protein DL96DRAFT_1595865 [Flagelloscypha sp. PMI_526]
MARGLPPVRPRHFYGSRTATARQSTVSPAFDVVANGGMEGSISPWTITTKAIAKWESITSYAHTGSGSVFLTAGGDQLSQNLVGLTPDAKYQLDLWISPFGAGTAPCTLTGSIDSKIIFTYVRPAMAFTTDPNYSKQSSLVPYTATQTTAPLLLSYTCNTSGPGGNGWYGAILLDDINLTRLP